MRATQRRRLEALEYLALIPLGDGGQDAGTLDSPVVAGLQEDAHRRRAAEFQGEDLVQEPLAVLPVALEVGDAAARESDHQLSPLPVLADGAARVAGDLLGTRQQGGR